MAGRIRVRLKLATEGAKILARSACIVLRYFPKRTAII